MNKLPVTKITVISALELTDEQRLKIEDVFGRKHAGGIRVDYLVDDSLIGGLIVFDGKTVYDGSVKTKLASIKEKLSHGND